MSALPDRRGALRPDAVKDAARIRRTQLLTTVYPALAEPVNAPGQHRVISPGQAAFGGVPVPDRAAPRGRVLRFLLAFREPIGGSLRAYVLNHWPRAEFLEMMGRMVADGLVTDEVKPCASNPSRSRHLYRLTALGVAMAEHLEGGAS